MNTLNNLADKIAISQTSSENITPLDPNEKDSSPGYGQQRLVAPSAPLQYTIYFENVITATAPAQEVFVTDYLDPNLDWTSLQLTEIAWGDQSLAIPPGNAEYIARSTVEDYRPLVEKAWWVDTSIAFNTQTGRLRWTFRTLDPETGLLPEDPFAGFLPPNDDTSRGEGHVSFTILPKASVPMGTILTNQASIIFDVNSAIATNPVTNTLGIPPNLIMYLPLVIQR